MSAAMKRLATILCLLPTLASAADQVPVSTVPCTTCVTSGKSDVDVRVSTSLRNDLAGLLIKLQQLGACDLPCHLISAKTLVALEAAVPVKEALPDSAATR